MKYKALFFDADGVLIKNKFLFTDQLKLDYGIEIEKMLPFFTGMFRQCSVGKADLREELSNVIETWGWNGSVDDLLRYWFTKGTQIDEEVISYIQSIRQQGLRCFMATDQERYRGEHLEETLGSGKIFERVFYSAQTGYPKKEQKFWDYVFEKINRASRVGEMILPQQCFFTDDSEENVQAVAAFGIDTFLFTDLDSLKNRLV